MTKLATSTRILSITLVAAGLLVTGCDTEGPLILPTQPAAEQAYEELTRGWLEWALEQPWSTGPIEDPSGASCAIDQQGPVWFLAGTNGGPVSRECTVPLGKALYFPLVNAWVLPPLHTVDQPEEEAGYLAWVPGYFAATRASVCELHLRVDGEDILADTEELDENLYVSVVEPFDIMLGEDNCYGRPEGLHEHATHAGHFALLAPLSPGEHEVEFGGSLCDELGVPVFETSATYQLHVGNP